MNIYSINITAPIRKGSDIRVSYNESPIICITKKHYDDILSDNESLRATIRDIIGCIGEELIDDININIRTIDNDRNVDTKIEPLKKYYETWK